MLAILPRIVPVPFNPHASSVPAPPEAKSVAAQLQMLGIRNEPPLAEFIHANLTNIRDLAGYSHLPSQAMAEHLSTLLEIAGAAGAQDNISLVRDLTRALLSSITCDDLLLAQSGAAAVKTQFDSSVDHQGNTPLDTALNSLGLSYHKATHDNRAMGHAQEMRSDVGGFFAAEPHQDLARMLAYFHDHVQLLDANQMGIGNKEHWGFNEIATAAALATLAGQARASTDEQAALLKVAGAVIPSGTAFGFIAGAGGQGKPGLGTIIESMLRSDTLPPSRSAAANELIAMAYTLAICDTQRNNLQGLARPTDASIQKSAPSVYGVLRDCANADPEAFGATFFDDGKLNETGLALCSKLTTTADVFKEFAPHTLAAPKFRDDKPNNPLSRHLVPGSLSPLEQDQATYQLISTNGTFGSSDVAADIASWRTTFTHPVLARIEDASLVSNPGETFKAAYQTIAQHLQNNGFEGAKLTEFIKQMSAMGGSFEPPVR